MAFCTKQAVLGKKHVRRDRGNDNHIQVFGRQAGLAERPTGGFDGQVGGGLIGGGNMPLLDAGARCNPFIGRIHHLGKIRVGQDTLGQIGTGADNGYRSQCFGNTFVGNRLVFISRRRSFS